MKTKILKLLAVAVLAGLSAAADTRAKNPWEDPAVNAFNRLPARTYAMPLADDAAAFTDDLEPATPFVKSLNGDDLNRASPPVYTENEEPVITEENIKFVFHLPNGETLEAINGSESDPEVVKASKTIADNFRELRELSKNRPAVYEAGKRMMVALDGKALPPGIIAKLVLEASNAKIDAIRKLSPRSSALEIHHAISQFSENIVTAMNLSEAEAKTATSERTSFRSTESSTPTR